MSLPVTSTAPSEWGSGKSLPVLEKCHACAWHYHGEERDRWPAPDLRGLVSRAATGDPSLSACAECGGCRYVVRYLDLSELVKCAVEEARREAASDFRTNFRTELEQARLSEAREVVDS